jgi:hypothetical protein
MKISTTTVPLKPSQTLAVQSNRKTTDLLPKKPTRRLSFRLARFSKWIIPRHWFNCFANIDVTLEEFGTAKKNTKDHV